MAEGAADGHRALAAEAVREAPAENGAAGCADVDARDETCDVPAVLPLGEEAERARVEWAERGVDTDGAEPEEEAAEDIHEDAGRRDIHFVNV